MKKSIILRVLLTVNISLALSIVVCVIARVFLTSLEFEKLFLIIASSVFGISLCLTSLIQFYLMHRFLKHDEIELDQLS